MSILLIITQHSLGNKGQWKHPHGGTQIKEWIRGPRVSNITTSTTLSLSTSAKMLATSCDAFKSNNIIYRICLQHKYRKW
ncbi:hypothetical protein AB6A40_009051 [Gnathostoma spinigerum]|uniref:Uncharacterized protein n=1 Tax=Gnathostoma spinigerum TaxID=75299 RepID=A0ABD6F023_9BILA